MDLKWFDDYLMGNSHDAYKHFGAHFAKDADGNSGVEFLVYAPRARQINVLGDFNNFSIYGSLMEKIDYRGLFRYFAKGAKNYQSYKLHIQKADGHWVEKSDPFAFFNELRPSMYSRVFDLNDFVFHDDEFMSNRDRGFDKPISIYELHLGSWKGRKADGTFYSYEEMADMLIPYLLENEFTHIELMPVTQYPYDGSWGYQPTGYFSIDSRYGNPKQLMSFVDRMHQAGISVLLDFVPVHFATDNYGLGDFDGSKVYEYDNENEYSQWGTKNFDLGKDPVRSFLISSMCYFLEVYHFDGVRFDAVSNIIYYDGNSSRGTNQGGIDFLKRANWTVHEFYKGAITIAEDSSSYGLVTKGFSNQGLGFDYKWDLGWMNDTLKYYKLDPVYKRFNHNLITFSMMYFYSENFILPLSHDEVVHMKGSILNKMWGDQYQKFALVRNLYAYQFAHPGKKLNFMGNELATWDEWSEKKSLSWNLTSFPSHDSVKRLFRDLNRVYKNHRCMYYQEYNPDHFKWIKVDDADQSVFVFKREVEDEVMLFVFNMTPNFYPEFRIGVPYRGIYEEVLNTDKDVYGGSNQYNGGEIISDDTLADYCYNSIVIKLASFAACYLKLVKKVPYVEPKKKKITKKKVEKVTAKQVKTKKGGK